MGGWVLVGVGGCGLVYTQMYVHILCTYNYIVHTHIAVHLQVACAPTC